MSTIAWTEFLCGPIGPGMLERARSFLPEIVPFTSTDCEASADFFNLAGRKRRTLADCMIAAVAIRSGAALATTNPKDYQRFGSALRVIAP